MSYLLFLGLPKPPFDIAHSFPGSVELTDVRDSPIGCAVFGIYGHGMVNCVTHSGCSTNALGKAHRRLNCDAAVRESIRAVA